jgi:predicted site-specific integrase-resolvase
MNEYVSGKQAQEILGVHQQTLYNWDKKKLIETIRTPGGKRLYNVKKYLDESKKNESNIIHLNSSLMIDKKTEKYNYIYARVSSHNQKPDLERQIEILKMKYPNYKLISDIGSGINLNRRGLRLLIDQAIMGKINEIVIVYKDRLCRFGYELIEDLIKKYSNGKIIILENKINKDVKEELVDDVLQIMNIFVAKINGLRKYKKKKLKTYIDYKEI